MAEREQRFAGGHHLDVMRWGPAAGASPTLVLLHEGLGCIETWRDWPERLTVESGLPVLAFSRYGYGRSDALAEPRALGYMHDEGRVTLPELLDAAGVRDAILVGHSDGASIAIVHAGSAPGPRLRALVLLAPHLFCEDVSVASIARARDAFVDGDLRARLARHHGDRVDGAFWGWNRAWLDPAFRRWNIEEMVPRITVPILVIQGDADPYGTLAQVEALERGARVPVTRLILPACGHAPQRDFPSETTRAIVDFARAVIDG